MSDKLTIREAARKRVSLGGPDAQALEGALQQAERELSAAQDTIKRLKSSGQEKVESDYQHFLSYSGLSDNPLLRYAYYHGAGADCDKPQEIRALTQEESIEVIEAMGFPTIRARGEG